MRTEAWAAGPINKYYPSLHLVLEASNAATNKQRLLRTYPAPRNWRSCALVRSRPGTDPCMALLTGGRRNSGSESSGHHCHCPAPARTRGQCTRHKQSSASRNGRPKAVFILMRALLRPPPDTGGRYADAASKLCTPPRGKGGGGRGGIANKGVNSSAVTADSPPLPQIKPRSTGPGWPCFVGDLGQNKLATVKGLAPPQKDRPGTVNARCP